MTTRFSITRSPDHRITRCSHRLFFVLSVVALAYAFIAGLRTVTDYDLGWQLATGRWVAQHHQIPSTDVFSYTAQGKPWIYPVGSGLVFYATYLLGKYVLLSWLGAAACVGTVAMLLRRGSAVSAVLAILAVPLIAARTTPRADIFTVVLFAAVLTLLWQQHETGCARLWLLPVLMVAWVNLHLGLVSGLALLGGYVLLEALEMLWPERRQTALDRLRRSWPWLIATCVATLVNPWGWRIYPVLLSLMAPMTAHSAVIAEYVPAKLSWTTIMAGLSLRDPDSFLLLLLVAAIAILIALARRQLGAAVLLSGAAILGVLHLRFEALFSIIVVIIGGAVLTPPAGWLQSRIKDPRAPSILAAGVSSILVLLVCIWSADLITDRAYFRRTDPALMGTGLSWWFPEGAASFIEREKIPGQIFNTYAEGGYLLWRFGSNYRDYADSRGAPFWPDLVQRSITLMATSPDSPEWQREAERYNINSVLLPLGRYRDLESFPELRQFCASDSWRPVYLDEVSVVFVRLQPKTESLIQRLQIDCTTAPLPAIVPARRDAKAFNQWAHAAAVLNALGRSSEAFAATTRALSIFPGSAYVHFTRAELLAQAGNLRDAEQQYLAAVALQPDDSSWARLAQIYDQQHRLDQAIQAWEHVAELAPVPYLPLLSLGYDYLDARRPREALKAFDRAQNNLPSRSAWGILFADLTYGPVMGSGGENPILANLAHGRALAWSALGNLNRAIAFQEKAARLSPEMPENWLDLASLYDQRGRIADAQRARERAAALNQASGRSSGDPVIR